MPSPKLNHRIQSRLSIIASIRVNLYEKVTRKKVGKIFDDSDILSCVGRSQSSRRLLEHSSKYSCSVVSKCKMNKGGY
jgi:hypothetical protein